MTSGCGRRPGCGFCTRVPTGAGGPCHHGMPVPFETKVQLVPLQLKISEQLVKLVEFVELAISNAASCAVPNPTTTAAETRNRSTSDAVVRASFGMTSGRPPRLTAYPCRLLSQQIRQQDC